MDMKWYVVYTKPGSEKKVSEILTRKKIENYSPVNSLSSRWGDNKKIKDTPLFKCYVFVKTSEQQHQELKKIMEVVNLVYWKGKPVSIKDTEIKAIKLFLNEYSNVTLEKTAIIHNDNINTIDDSIADKEAPIISIKNKKACVALPSLGYILNAEIEKPNVRIISVEGISNRADIKTGNLFDKVSGFNNSLKNYWVKALVISVCVFLVSK